MTDLPYGRGGSPLQNLIIRNKEKTKISAIKVDFGIDSGVIYEKINIKTKGDELLDGLRKLQAKVTSKLILNFIDKYPNIIGIKQMGEESFYKKRTKKNSELNVSKTIKEQFNLLRVCDNNRYPAFFYINNVKYLLKIYKDG